MFKIKKNKDMVGSLKGQESEIVRGDEEKAELLHSYFSSFFSSEGNGAHMAKTEHMIRERNLLKSQLLNMAIEIPSLFNNVK